MIIRTIVRNVLCTVILMSLAACLPIQARAQSGDTLDSTAALDAATPSDWDFSIRPYFFLSGISGSVTAEPLTLPINSSFGDLVDNVKIGAFAAVTGEKGSWGFHFDFQYISLEGEATGRLGTTLKLENLISEGDLTYRPPAVRSLRLLAGARLYQVDETLTITRRVDDPIGGPQSPYEATTTVVDPIIGAAGNWALSPHWEVELRGDIGGFGIGSEFTNQLALAVLWRISDTVSFPFGYRVVDYQIKSDDVWLDTRMGGLMIGVDFRL